MDTDDLRGRHAAALGELAGRRAIGYFCSYVPREIADALALPNLRLAGCASPEAARVGEGLLGSEVCSWCSSLAGAQKLDAWPTLELVAGCTTCDQMRRHVELWPRLFGKKAFLFGMPATHQDPSCLAYYTAEIRALAEAMAAVAGRPLNDVALVEAIRRRNEARALLRNLRPRVSAAVFLALVHLDFVLDAQAVLDLLRRVDEDAGAGDEVARRRGRRLMIAGSPLGMADLPLLEAIEGDFGASLVADLTCTGDRWVDFNVEVSGDPLESIARSYFRRPPCVWRRPNDELHAYASALARARGVQGLIYRTVKFCDVWNYEGQRFAEGLDLPTLVLDVATGEADDPRTRTRVEAFLEGLR